MKQMMRTTATNTLAPSTFIFTESPLMELISHTEILKDRVETSQCYVKFFGGPLLALRTFESRLKGDLTPCSKEDERHRAMEDWIVVKLTNGQATPTQTLATVHTVSSSRRTTGFRRDITNKVSSIHSYSKSPTCCQTSADPQGVHGSSNYPDSVIRCVFQRYSEYYRDIASLGANFSARFDQTIPEISETCKYQNRVLQRISIVSPTCGDVLTDGVVPRITSLIQQLCLNKTSQQSNFLNSSVCYNRHQITRLNCVKKYSVTQTDAKSLCCSNLKIQQCIRQDMQILCPRNATEFQAHLAETYTSHEFAVCGSYLSHCNGAVSLLLSSSIVLVVLVSLLFQGMVI